MPHPRLQTPPGPAEVLGRGPERRVGGREGVRVQADAAVPHQPLLGVEGVPLRLVQGRAEIVQLAGELGHLRAVELAVALRVVARAPEGRELPLDHVQLGGSQYKLDSIKKTVLILHLHKSCNQSIGVFFLLCQVWFGELQIFEMTHL